MTQIILNNCKEIIILRGRLGKGLDRLFLGQLSGWEEMLVGC